MYWRDIPHSYTLGHACHHPTPTCTHPTCHTTLVPLQEWAEQYGLPSFTDGTFEKALQLVHTRLMVTHQRRAPHNGQNGVLRQGLAALGCEPQDYPSNCDGLGCSSYCALGCR